MTDAQQAAALIREFANTSLESGAVAVALALADRLDPPAARVEPMVPGRRDTLYRVVAASGDVVAESLTLNEATYCGSLVAEGFSHADAATMAASDAWMQS